MDHATAAYSLDAVLQNVMPDIMPEFLRPR